MRKPFLLYDNRFADAAPTPNVTTADGDYDPLYLSDLRPYTFWKSAVSGQSVVISVDCGSAKAANTLGIAGHNLFTAGASVSVYASDHQGYGYSVVMAETTMTSDNVFVATFSSVSKRYWNVTIENTTVAPIIACLNLGVRLDFPDYPDGPVTPFEEKVVADSSDSKAGNLLGVLTRYFPWEAAYKFSHISGSWYSGLYRTFWTGHGRLFKSFFWSPSDEIAAAFCRMSNSASYKPVHRFSTDLIESMDFKVQGIDYGV